MIFNKEVSDMIRRKWTTAVPIIIEMAKESKAKGLVAVLKTYDASDLEISFGIRLLRQVTKRTLGCVSQARGEYWPTRILATYFEYEERPHNKTTGATRGYMVMAIYPSGVYTNYALAILRFLNMWPIFTWACDTQLNAVLLLSIL